MLSSQVMSSPVVGLEAVAVSPTVPRTPLLPLSARSKRRLTPSLEKSSSKRTLLVVPQHTFAPQLENVDLSNPLLPPIPKCLFQASTAQIVARSPLNLIHGQFGAYGTTIQANPLHHAHQEASQIASQMNPLLQGSREVEFPRHIILPFDLRLTPDVWTEDRNTDILMSLFPGCFGLGFDGLFLLYQVTVLPSKPWPKTIAGVPCHLTVGDMGPGPLPHMAPAYMANPQISKDIDGRDLTNWDSAFDLIKSHFEQLDISITEVQYWGTYVMIVLEIEAVDFMKIPKSIANLRCFYVFENQMGRPEVLQARRQYEPTPGNADETKYSTLRPGVRLASSYNPCTPGAYLSTSAGILVEDRTGNVFMTAASHGFPGNYGTKVFQPTPVGDQAIGELIMEIGHTDIALVKLKDDVIFENITFHGDILTEPMRLDRFATTKTTKRLSIVQLDSPDTGYIEGNVRVSSRTRIPGDDHLEPKQQWLQTTWFYMGQDCSQDLPDGMCGSAIWDEDGSVLGFFRYSPKTGVMKDWCAGIAADELIDRGYTVVTPPMV